MAAVCQNAIVTPITPFRSLRRFQTWITALDRDVQTRRNIHGNTALVKE
jgi:hypothetical protein